MPCSPWAVASGWAKLQIEASAAQKQARIDSGADVIVGRIRQILNALDLTPEQIMSADVVVPTQIAALAKDLEMAER